ncbi:glycoside hydrolase family protein [Clostridium saccharoperbutylacetonicum]|uniref:glycoside hydrolase family protein n=1 Tax=Clostridium saccharoperbutylacetonicum TaxID=36745 RepID=UPI00098397F5|nr:NlpC/P60 family protein [Clostridium saccharoperbutylacetonicum]AQR93396.1 putative endopeptidase YafL precursor [Clostridium saccharoperbutylacetonicum]NSB29093.1 GH24 family phage-related lysozyme (muramidase)/cell wall-associated NlpC family hydrolase [Clostridium saccharoperbutylacetonicum]
MAEDNIIGNISESIGTGIDKLVGNASSTISSVVTSLKMDNLKVTTTDSKGNTTTEEAEAVNNTATAPDSILKTYGIRQEIITQTTHQDARITAFRKLNENCKPKEEIEVECIGDVNYKVGYGVHVILPFLPQYEDCFMYIKEVNNEWQSNGMFTSTLTLTPSRVMDEQEWQDDPQDDSTGGSNGSQLAEKIISLLKQQINKPYIWGASGPDTFDCSGLLQYCYNQFSSELTSGALGRTTYDQVKQGTDVDKNDKGQWQPADLLFWKGDGSYPAPSHVSVYIGDNQMIHAPKSNDVVKIVEISRTDIYAVKRVIPEDQGTSTGSMSNSVSSKLVEFVKSKEGFKSTAYYDSGGLLTIGYGFTKDDVPDAFTSDSITQEKATQLLRGVLNKHAKAVQALLDKKKIALMQCQFDALVDFAYNCGDTKLETSGLLAFAYGESDKTADGAFMVITRDAHGNQLAGLVTRRKEEASMWKYGTYGSSSSYVQD